MTTLVLLIHLVSCLILILVILLQSGKSADLAGAFGGMGSQTTFGPRGGATLLSRVTTIAAVVFMITSLALSIMMSQGVEGSSVVNEPAATQTTPAQTPNTQQPAPANKPAAATVPAQQGTAAGEKNVQYKDQTGGAVKSIEAKPLTKEEYEKMMGKSGDQQKKNTGTPAKKAPGKK